MNRTPVYELRPPYAYHLPVEIHERAYLFVFAKMMQALMETIPGDHIDGLCVGCRALSLRPTLHSGCVLQNSFKDGPIDLDRNELQRRTVELCEQEDVAPPDTAQMSVLWTRCQTRWRHLAICSIMDRFTEFPDW